MEMYEIIIIGAGPGGISMAVEAHTAGIENEKILILEKTAEHSFSIKKYYPDTKLVTANYKGFEAVCAGVMCLRDSTKQETISYLDQAIQNNTIKVHYGETVFSIHKFPNGQQFTITTDTGTYDSKIIVIAIGILGKPNKPEYKLPPLLKDKLVFDLTTIPIANSNVLVVGGGDSASEYCQYLVQQGNRVTLSYRRNDFSRMNDINRASIRALAERKLVEFIFESNIQQVVNVNGSPEVEFKEPHIGKRIYDYVVYALGGTTPKNFLKLIGIEFDGEEPYLKDGYETNVPGLFLIGDLSAGSKGGSIIWAFNSAQRAMRKICTDYLECKL
jgi:thioredoxin reductase (NADPH)